MKNTSLMGDLLAAGRLIIGIMVRLKKEKPRASLSKLSTGAYFEAGLIMSFVITTARVVSLLPPKSVLAISWIDDL